MDAMAQMTENTIIQPAIPATFASRNVNLETGLESRSSRVPFFASRCMHASEQITAAMNPRNMVAAILLSRIAHT